MSKTLKDIESSVERQTGQKVSVLRNLTFSEIRRNQEAKGIKTVFTSVFPFIGRGNILRKFMSSDEVNSMVDKSIK